jgi:hypothetical protein
MFSTGRFKQSHEFVLTVWNPVYRIQESVKMSFMFEDRKHSRSELERKEIFGNLKAYSKEVHWVVTMFTCFKL